MNLPLNTDGDLENVDDDNGEAVETEDQTFDNFEDAANSLADDEEPTEEEPTEEAAEEEQAEDEAESDGGDVVVALPDGTELTVSEIADLQANGLRTADYTRKTTEVAREREEVQEIRTALDERTDFVDSTLQNLAGFLQSLIPPEPSLQLAASNPGKYQYELALRKTAIAEFQKLGTMKQEVDSHRAQVSETDIANYKRAEDAKLVKAMPHLSDPAKRAVFDKSVREFAAEMGIPQDRIEKTHDATMLQLVHYARLGKRAEHNRNNSKRRVETPKTGKRVASKPVANAQNDRAMAALSKSGSFADAMKIDFSD